MENGGEGGEGGGRRRRFGPNAALTSVATMSIRGTLNRILSSVDEGGRRPVVPLGHGDPSAFPCFRTTPLAEDAVVAAVRSAQFNSYSSAVGVLSARSGCTQAIEVIVAVLARPGANILLPKPGFLMYEARAAYCGLEFRHFNLISEKGWEIDLEEVEALADDKTAAIVVINPNNPCGNVFTYQNLAKVAETARKLGIMVIADEVYDHLAFGSNPFVPMGVFGEIVPVITLGSISKRWVVPGWRLGWIATSDPKGILRETKVAETARKLGIMVIADEVYDQVALSMRLLETVPLGQVYDEILFCSITDLI